MNFVLIPLLNGELITLNLHAVAYITERSVVLNQMDGAREYLVELQVTPQTAEVLTQVAIHFSPRLPK